MPRKCSIVIPVLNDADQLKHLLMLLQPARQQGHEIVVVDGGSIDRPQAVTENLADKFFVTEPGRAHQMNKGAMAASGDVLWFLHADSRLDVGLCLQEVLAVMNNKRIWGRFDVILSGSDWRLRLVEFMMNFRSRLTGIATGDQGLFVNSKAFEHVGGYAEIALMEDIQLSRSLGKITRPVNSFLRITTSSRRWEQNGILRTILLMWVLRLGFFLGISPSRLVKLYR